MSYRLSINNHSRVAAMAAVAALHIGLVIAISQGLYPTAPMAISPDFTVTTIDPPPKTPPKPSGPTTVTLTKPWVDPLPLPPVPVERHPITTHRQPPTETTTVTAPVVVAPSVDTRHPLTQPRYPASSRRAGEEGTVELSLFVLANGRVDKVTIARSSGFEKLDDAARKEAMRGWRFKPQTVDGLAVAAWHRISVTFRLENSQ